MNITPLIPLYIWLFVKVVLTRLACIYYWLTYVLNLHLPMC